MDEPGPPAAAEDVTVEQLLQMLSRMKAREPHVPCPEGRGPLAPLALALDRLSAHVSRAQPQPEDVFGPQTLVAQSPSFMITADTEERIRFINTTRFGLTQADVVGTSLYQWLPPEVVEPTRARIRKVLATGESLRVDSPGKDASASYWFSGEIGPIREGKRIVGFTLITSDITELKRTQQRLERSNRELENFASIASHDLQEPLHNIQTFGERLKTTCSDALSPEGRDYIERMQKAASRMGGLIEDLLAFSRVSSTSKPFVSVDLGAVAREVLGDLAPLIARTGASITLGELPVLEADPPQMRQLLLHLMANALKFHRQGIPPVISVRATVHPRAQRCELEVEDNGIGFEQKYAERIFNVFQRLHGRGQYEGSGIGLAICRKIAERHGGGITARGSPGRGSSFHVSLPLHPSP